MKEGESHLDAMLRGEVLSALISFDHEDVVTEAARRFDAFLKDRGTPLLPADIRSVHDLNSQLKHCFGSLFEKKF